MPECCTIKEKTHVLAFGIFTAFDKVLCILKKIEKKQALFRMNIVDICRQ